MRRLLAFGLIVTSILTAAGPSGAAPPAPGDIVVIDYRAGTPCVNGFNAGCGAMFVVDAQTGNRALFSDFGDPGQGPLGRTPYGIARDPASGHFYVLDQQAGVNCPGAGGAFGCGPGALFRVDRVTGQRTIVSDFSDPGQGPIGLDPFTVAVQGAGQLLVTDTAAGGGSGALFRVDAASGQRTIVSNFSDASQGEVGGRAGGVAMAANGALVTDGFLNRLLRVDLGTGQRTIASDFANSGQGPVALVPIAVTPDPVSGEVLVVTQLQEGLVPGYGALFSVNASTGNRRRITDFSTPVQGPLGFNPSGVDVAPGGDILVIDFDSGTNSLGAIFNVNRVTGARCYLSDFGNPAQGPLGNEPSGLVIVPGGPSLRTGLAAAVLPTSRSVQVGTTATAFVTIVNAGCVTAKDVGIALATFVDATFGYQTTDPATNVPVGSPNTPVDVPAGGSQTFVIAITPRSAFAPVDVTFAFAGTNTSPVPVLVGINTLLLSASDTPVPDIVALMATLNGDGIVEIPGPNGTGVCAVATVNVGAGGSITVSANTGAAALPVTAFVCQTDAAGACLAPPANALTVQIDAGATPTFGVFVAGSGIVPFDPALNRVFVIFKDGNGITRGATSGALRTK